MRLRTCSTVILACMLVLRSAPTLAADDTDAVFATTLYHHLAAQKGNLLLSPLSIRTAFGMAYAGSAGNTAAQMRAVLGSSAGDQQALVQSIGAAAKQLNTPSAEYTLAVANALWGEATFPFDPAFGKQLVNDFDANLHRANFRAGSDAARGDINHWVARQTKGKIADLFPPGSITPQTALVLANAVYFKAKWETPFKTRNTHDAPFHLESTHLVNTPTMHGRFEELPYAETDALQAVDLPYRGGLSMTLLVPKAIDGLPAVEEKLDATMLQALLAALRPQTVALAMPKLKLSSSFALSDTLIALGMPDAFDPKRANFTGMIAADHPSPGPLFIGQVFHRAVAEVNEQGTEAAAATGIGMVAGAMRLPQQVMTVDADRPYLLLIRQPSSGAILFMGRVSDPR